MSELKNMNNSERLPLSFAYPYLVENGLESEMNEIRQSKDKFMSFTSSLKASKTVDLMEKNNLLNDFIEKYWAFGKTEKGKVKLRWYKSIYNRFCDNVENDEETEIEETEDSTFAYESDLRDYLAKNLSVIEQGLRLYIDSDGKEGVEYSIDSNNKRIDILAMDKNNNPVVIELKLSQGYERVIGQALYYKGMIKELFKKNNVRIFIIAKEITNRLKKATEDLTFVELFEYSLSVSVKKV
jgi:RecB family endonuclease NucS